MDVQTEHRKEMRQESRQSSNALLPRLSSDKRPPRLRGGSLQEGQQNTEPEAALGSTEDSRKKHRPDD